MIVAVDGAETAGWDPAIIVSGKVARTPRIEQFVAQTRSGYSAPPITFDEPQELLVSGRHFAVVTRRAGLIDASVHTLPRFRWGQAFAAVAQIRFAPEGAALIAASAGYGNYFHWTMETLGAALMHRDVRPGEAIPLVVPPLHDAWQRDALGALGLDNPLITLPGDGALVIDAGVLTSLTGPGHSFAPHPAMLAAFRRQMSHAGTSGPPRSRVYVSRADAVDRRRMENEADLCSVLAEIGFEIVTAGTLPVAEQAALFREAEVIVSPHGAALTNLVYAGDGDAGPAVIELFQENYLNRCFLKLCQCKRLSYAAVVNPCVSPGPHHHQSTWRADIALIRKVVTDVGGDS